MLKAKPDFNFAGDWCRMPDSKFKASLDNLSSCFKKESEKQEWGGELRGRAQGLGFYLQFPKTNNKKIVLIFFQASQEAVPEPVRPNFPSSSCLLQPPPVLARCMPLPPSLLPWADRYRSGQPCSSGPNQQVWLTLRTSQDSFTHSLIKKTMKIPREFMLSKANG